MKGRSRQTEQTGAPKVTEVQKEKREKRIWEAASPFDNPHIVIFCRYSNFHFLVSPVLQSGRSANVRWGIRRHQRAAFYPRCPSGTKT